MMADTCGMALDEIIRKGIRSCEGEILNSATAF